MSRRSQQTGDLVGLYSALVDGGTHALFASCSLKEAQKFTLITQQQANVGAQGLPYRMLEN
jgi:hypothetical protein